MQTEKIIVRREKRIFFFICYSLNCLLCFIRRYPRRGAPINEVIMLIGISPPGMSRTMVSVIRRKKPPRRAAKGINLL
jgi:hypothetical protein